MKTFSNHKLIKIKLLTSIILITLLGFSVQSFAQSQDRNTLLQMIDEDRTTLDAIAGYNQDIQRHILQVAQTPEALNKIEELQKKSQSRFREIIENYDRDAQSAFYELARYPGLITDLVSNGLPSKSEVDRIVSNYPDDIHTIAINNSRRYFDVLVRIDQLNNEIDGEFQQYLEPYSARTRESVKVLLAYPEIVSALIDDMNFTTKLGEVYSEDPEWTEHYLDQVSQQLAEQSKEDLDAYKNQIQNDPEAYNEMLEASEKFAKDRNEVRYIDNSSGPVVDITVINSYPFWFGYPYWYSDPYWRPRPIYYHTGFYRNNFGAVVFVGLPSFQFIHWQTYYHPTLFPHLSYNYYSYYENHYVSRYRNSHRPVPYHRFYRSIESNVINNPRVNNSVLQRIDRQRGHDIVRRPNRMESGSVRRGDSGSIRRGETSDSRRGSEMNGSSGRRDNGTINRNRSEQNKAGTTRGNINRRSTERPNSNKSGGTINRRQYNSVNPGRSEGPVNRRNSESGSGTIRRGPSPVTSSSDGTSTGRSRQGSSINGSKNQNARSGNESYILKRENAAPSTTNRRTSINEGNSGASSQQRSAYPQQRRQTATPAERSGRVSQGREAASRVERSSAPTRSVAPSATARASGRSAQREARINNSQSSGRSTAREKQSSSPTVLSDRSNAGGSNRRRR